MIVLLNARAGGDADRARQAVRLHPDAVLVEVDDLASGAEGAAREGASLVVAAGGDGTVHAVANGLMRVGDTPEARPVLGILPMGTGNDLARTLALPLDAPAADLLHLAASGERRTIDLIHVACAPKGDCYAVNACSGGFTGQIDEAVTSDLKAAWGPLAYAIGTARALPEMETYHTTVAWDDGEPERVRAFNVLVANGRSIGGGTPVAPAASLEDGRLDVVVVLEGGALDVARLTAKAYTAGYTDDAKVLFRRVERVTIASEPGMWFNVDGEIHTDEQTTFSVVPGALRVAVGPTYVPTPEAV